MDTLHSPKLLRYSSLTIKLFSVISRVLFGGVLPLCRDAVGVFYSPSRLGYRIFVGVFLPFCWDAASVFCTPSRLGHRILVGRVLPLCKDDSSPPRPLGHLIQVSTVVVFLVPVLILLLQLQNSHCRSYFSVNNYCFRRSLSVCHCSFWILFL